MTLLPGQLEAGVRAARLAELNVNCMAIARWVHPFNDQARYAFFQHLRKERMACAGLPLSMLGDGKTASQRHAERMEEMHGPTWNRALAMTPPRELAA